MSDVLSEVTAEDLTRDQIQRRVDDWVQRIDHLYDEIERWLPAGWSVDRSRTKRMHEELMREFGIPPRELPILELLQNGQVAATVEPRGLWIIGANGRVDLVRGQKHYVIIDAAENLHPPRWRIAALEDRTRRADFNQAQLLSVL